MLLAPLRSICCAAILLAGVVRSLAAQPPAQQGTVNLKLGPAGEILAWFVIGPYPNKANADFTACTGFENEAIVITESRPSPTLAGNANDAHGPVWKLALADVSKGLDLSALYKPARPAVAYASATLSCNSDRDARILLGSDDGVKLWVNGRLMHTSHLTRGVTRDQERVEVRLKRGLNRLTFKVDQHYGAWGLTARIVNADGSPATDLVEVVSVQRWTAGSPAPFLHSLLESAIGLTGSLDVQAISEYIAWQRKSAMWMPWLKRTSNGAKALQASLDESSRRMKRRRASCQQITSALRLSSSSIEKHFRMAWSDFSKEIQQPGPLIPAIPSREDYIRVADGGRYFVRGDGTFFTPIGYNHNPDWSPLAESAIGKDFYDISVTDRYFAKLRRSGVNVIRIMLECPAGGHFLENPVGVFNPEQVAWLDNIFTLARKWDVKLMITPWDTFWMNHRWNDNPFNAKNGGPVERKIDFITKRAVIEAQKKRWKFIIDRWGNTGDVFAWELLNESDYWWDGTPEQVQAWAKEVGEFVRDYEMKRWGRNHLICISTGRPIPDGGWADLAYRQPGMDLATTHLYLDAANAPDEPIGPAVAIRRGVTYALRQIRDNRPYIDGENGPINRWIADRKLDEEVFHNMSWAHLASGGAGSSFRWPYRNPHYITDGMLRHLSRMRRFANEVSWQRLIGPRSQIHVSVPEGWVACSTGTHTCAIIWVAAPKPVSIGMTVSWPDGPSHVRYRCYDTKAGIWFAKGTIKTSDGSFTLPTEGERSSVAVVLEGE